MITAIHHNRTSLTYRLLSAFMALTFVFSIVVPPTPIYAQATPQSILNLPIPGTMVSLTPGFNPPLVKGITIHPDNPLKFDFLVSSGDNNLTGKDFRKESKRLIKYFLAGLTVPDEELWVNLSPYEKDRVISKQFGETEMGRDMLAQDYILKQLTASLMYPEEQLGKQFWDRVHQKAYEQYGTTKIPMNTFNKIWIVPETAVVYEHEQTAFVVESHLKVMLEEDYLALEQFNKETNVGEGLKPSPTISGVSSEIVKEILIPEIEKEVNEGEMFAQLRQIYNSVILASWYKDNLQKSLLGQVYVDQGKTKGINVADEHINRKIYDQYLEAFKKGVYDYIKEDYDPATTEIIPRKYFSGGSHLDVGNTRVAVGPDTATPRQKQAAASPVMRVEADFFAQNGPNATEIAAAERRQEASAAASPISAQTQARIAEINRLLPEIAKELETPGSGDLPEYVFISDFHGGLKRFTQFLNEILHRFADFKGEIDPLVSIEEQLNAQEKSLKHLKGKILLGGDILDRGKDGVRVGMMVQELVEKGEGAVFSVTGNHDLWAFMNIMGVHLPWYEDYNFYEDTEAEGIISARRKTNPELFDRQEALLWWTQRLAEHNDDQNELQSTFADGKLKEIRQKFVDAHQTYNKDWSDAQKVAWENFSGNFVRISVPEPYVGLNGIGKASRAWWQTTYSQLAEALAQRTEAGANTAELEFWKEAISLAEKIHTEVSQRVEAAVNQGKWWYPVLDSINTQTYDSLEWWAKDWSSHAGWGTSVIDEINRMINAGEIDEPRIDQTNYITSPTLQALAAFYRANFNLHYSTAYGDLFTHGWIPVAEDGSISVTYKGKTTTGTDIYGALDAVARDVKDTTQSIPAIWPAFDLVNGWYADMSTIIKPANLRSHVKNIGVKVINSGIGVRNWFTGHNPIAKWKLGLPFMSKDEDRAHMEIDLGMAPKFGGQGGYVTIDRNGVHLRGFEHSSETHPDEAMMDAPPIHKFGKKGEVLDTFESHGLDSVEFLTAAQAQLIEERERLQSASSPIELQAASAASSPVAASSPLQASFEIESLPASFDESVGAYSKSRFNPDMDATKAASAELLAKVAASYDMERGGARLLADRPARDNVEEMVAAAFGETVKGDIEIINAFFRRHLFNEHFDHTQLAELTVMLEGSGVGGQRNVSGMTSQLVKLHPGRELLLYSAFGAPFKEKGEEVLGLLEKAHSHLETTNDRLNLLIKRQETVKLLLRAASKSGTTPETMVGFQEQLREAIKVLAMFVYGRKEGLVVSEELLKKLYNNKESLLLSGEPIRNLNPQQKMLLALVLDRTIIATGEFREHQETGDGGRARVGGSKFDYFAKRLAEELAPEFRELGIEGVSKVRIYDGLGGRTNALGPDAFINIAMLLANGAKNVITEIVDRVRPVAKAISNLEDRASFGKQLAAFMLQNSVRSLYIGLPTGIESGVGNALQQLIGESLDVGALVGNAVGIKPIVQTTMQLQNKSEFRNDRRGDRLYLLVTDEFASDETRKAEEKTAREAEKNGHYVVKIKIQNHSPEEILKFFYEMMNFIEWYGNFTSAKLLSNIANDPGIVAYLEENGVPKDHIHNIDFSNKVEAIRLLTILYSKSQASENPKDLPEEDRFLAALTKVVLDLNPWYQPGVEWGKNAADKIARELFVRNEERRLIDDPVSGKPVEVLVRNTELRQAFYLEQATALAVNNGAFIVDGVAYERDPEYYGAWPIDTDRIDSLREAVTTSGDKTLEDVKQQLNIIAQLKSEQNTLTDEIGDDGTHKLGERRHMYDQLEQKIDIEMYKLQMIASQVEGAVNETTVKQLAQVTFKAHQLGQSTNLSLYAGRQRFEKNGFGQFLNRLDMFDLAQHATDKQHTDADGDVAGTKSAFQILTHVRENHGEEIRADGMVAPLNDGLTVQDLLYTNHAAYGDVYKVRQVDHVDLRLDGQTEDDVAKMFVLFGKANADYLGLNSTASSPIELTAEENRFKSVVPIGEKNAISLEELAKRLGTPKDADTVIPISLTHTVHINSKGMIWRDGASKISSPVTINFEKEDNWSKLNPEEQEKARRLQEQFERDNFKRKYTAVDVIFHRQKFKRGRWKYLDRAIKLSQRFRELLSESLESKKPILSLGVRDGKQAVDLAGAQAGHNQPKVVYVSGAQTAADKRRGRQVFPDLSLSAFKHILNVLREINRATTDDVITLVDAEQGAGEGLQTFERIRQLIQAGASAIHLETQDTDIQTGGKLEISFQAFRRRLTAARLAADVFDVPLVIVGRSDGFSAQWARAEANESPTQRQFFLGTTENGEMTLKEAQEKGLSEEAGTWTPIQNNQGHYRIKGGIDYVIASVLNFADLADAVWYEAENFTTNEPEQFAQAIRAKFPKKKLFFNIPAIVVRDRNIKGSEEARNAYFESLKNLGYNFVFITIAGQLADDPQMDTSMNEMASAFLESGFNGYFKITHNVERKGKFKGTSPTKTVKQRGWKDVGTTLDRAGASSPVLQPSVRDRRILDAMDKKPMSENAIAKASGIPFQYLGQPLLRLVQSGKLKKVGTKYRKVQSSSSPVTANLVQIQAVYIKLPGKPRKAIFASTIAKRTNLPGDVVQDALNQLIAAGRAAKHEGKRYSKGSNPRASSPIKSTRGRAGETIHRNESGEHLGRSESTLRGPTQNFDADGRRIGDGPDFSRALYEEETGTTTISSDAGYGETVHRDSSGNTLGISRRRFDGSTEHFDQNETRVGRDGSFFNSFKKSSSPVPRERVGGINLNPALMDLQIKRDGNGIPLPFNLQPAEVMNIEGFIPVIINVTPVVNVPLLLGFDLPADEKPYDSADSGTSTMELGFVDKYRNKNIREYQNKNIDA